MTPFDDLRSRIAQVLQHHNIFICHQQPYPHSIATSTSTQNALTCLLPDLLALHAVQPSCPSDPGADLATSVRQELSDYPDVWIKEHAHDDHMVTLDHKDEIMLMNTLMVLQAALRRYDQQTA